MSDSDGEVRIYDGSENIVIADPSNFDQATDDAGFELISGPTPSGSEFVYVFAPLGNLQDIALSLTVKAVGAGGAESIAGTTIAYTQGLEEFATAIEAAIAAILDDAANGDPATLDSIAGLNDLISKLDGAVGVTGSVKEQINTAKVALEVLITTQADRITQEITDRTNADTALAGDIADLADDTVGTFGEPGYEAPTLNSIAGLNALVTKLDSSVGVTGSVKEQINTAKVALEVLITVDCH